jgi:hypothetical protein
MPVYATLNSTVAQLGTVNKYGEKANIWHGMDTVKVSIITTLSNWPQIIKKVIKIKLFEPYAPLPISGCTYLYDQQYILVVNTAGLRGAIWARVLKNVCQPCSRPNKFKEYRF